MKIALENVIKHSIISYPTLYKFRDYEKSRLLVLNHMFLVIGNGYEWTEEGYLLPNDIVKSVFKKKITLPDDYFEGSDGSSCREFLNIDKDEVFICGPYPICEYSGISEMTEGYSNSVHIENFKFKKFQDDWLQGAKDIVNASFAYYNDKNRVKNHSYYPNRLGNGMTKKNWEKFRGEQLVYLSKFQDKFGS